MSYPDRNSLSPEANGLSTALPVQVARAVTALVVAFETLHAGFKYYRGLRGARAIGFVRSGLSGA